MVLIVEKMILNVGMLFYNLVIKDTVVDVFFVKQFFWG